MKTLLALVASLFLTTAQAAEIVQSFSLDDKQVQGGAFGSHIEDLQGLYAFQPFDSPGVLTGVRWEVLGTLHVELSYTGALPVPLHANLATSLPAWGDQIVGASRFAPPVTVFNDTTNIGRVLDVLSLTCEVGAATCAAFKDIDVYLAADASNLDAYLPGAHIVEELRLSINGIHYVPGSGLPAHIGGVFDSDAFRRGAKFVGEANEFRLIYTYAVPEPSTLLLLLALPLFAVRRRAP